MNLWQEIRGEFKEAASNIQKVPKKMFCVDDCRNTQGHRRKEVKKLEGNIIEVRRLNAEIQRRTRQDKEKYYTEKCKIIEVNKLGKNKRSIPRNKGGNR